MALTVVTTPGASTANSYCSLAEADTYHEAHRYASTWTAATDTQQNEALVMATRLIDQHMAWSGNVVTDTQALLWPRNGMSYESGYYIPNTVIPQGLKNATAEFARLIIASDVTLSGSSAGAVQALKVGSIEVKYAEGDASTASTEVIPDSVYFMVRLWAAVRRRSGGVTTAVRA